jgi:hypothetical protein
MSTIDDILAAPSAKSASIDEILGTKAPEKSGLIRRGIGDTAVSLGRGVIGVPEALTGMADLVTGGQAGKIQQDIGIDYKGAKDILSGYYSPEQKAANEEVNKAQGFFSTIGAMVQNPSTIAHQAIESSLTMLPGAGVARGALAVAPKLGAIAAGALGEGAVDAGQNAEQVRQEDPNGTLTPQQSAILAASGLLTGGISLAAGKAANKLGVGDIQTMLAAGHLGPVGEQAIAAGAKKGVLRKIGEGAATEGILQELPQSYQGQVAQNIAQGKPWDEGAGAAGAQGMLAGGLMGAAGAPLHSGGHAERTAAPLETPAVPLVQPAAPVAAVAPAAPPGAPVPAAGDPLRATKLPESGPLTRVVNLGVEQEAQAADAGAPVHAPVTALVGVPAEDAPHPDTPTAKTVNAADNPEAGQTAPPSPAPVQGAPTFDPATGEIKAPERATFPSREAVDLYLSQSRLNGTARTGKSVAVELPDGTFSFVREGEPGYIEAVAATPKRPTLADRRAREKNRAQLDVQPAESPAPGVRAAEPAGEGHPDTGAVAPAPTPLRERREKAIAEKKALVERETAAKRIGVPADWLAERQHMIDAGRTDTAIKNQHEWELADRALKQEYGYSKLGSDKYNEIQDAVAEQFGGESGVRKNQDAYTQELTRRIRAEAERMKSERTTEGTLANKRQAKQDDERRQEIVDRMHKANLEEIDLAVKEMQDLHRQGRLADADLKTLNDIAQTSRDSGETATRLHDLIEAKDTGSVREGIDKGTATNDAAPAKSPSVLTLKRQWSEAAAAGDTKRAAEINEQIVAAKKSAAAPGPQAEAPAPKPASERVAAAPVASVPAAPAKTLKERREAAKKPRGPNKAERGAAEQEARRADYFTPGNVVGGYGGFDEVLSYSPPSSPGGAWSVKVQHVTKGQASGQWVRVGKPQDARMHSTQPEERQLKNGPIARLTYEAGELVSYTEGRPDGQPFKNAPDRGVPPVAAEPAPAVAADKPAEKPAAKASEPAKPIADAGEKIGGARKDRWKDRGLNVSDLDSMSESEGAELATKANVWKPDWKAIVDGGMPAPIAAHAKIVYDRLAAQPKDNTPEGRRRYVKMMQAVREVYGNLTVENVEGARDRLLYDHLGWVDTRSGGVRIAAGSAEAAHMAEAKKTLFSVYKGRSEPFGLDWSDMRKVKSMVAEGFPEKGEPWARRFAIRSVGGPGVTEAGIRMHLADAEQAGTPLTADQIKAGVFAVRSKVGSKTMAYAATKADAEAAAKTVYTSSLVKDAGIEPERPHLDNIKREGLEKTIDRDVTQDDFLQHFGFRGVEFGNWSAQDERQKLLNLAYDGLNDLAMIVGVPAKALSLNGTMGMAFGARGGGRFAAHYEPGKLVINMTKIRGGGSLAHEWAHAFDHYLGELDTDNAYKGLARGASGWYSRGDYTGEPRKRMVKDAQGKWVPGVEHSLPNLRPELASAVNGVMRALYGEKYTPTQYAKEAQKLSGKSTDGYWIRPTEMWARAFESYAFDRLVAMGAKSEYLVHGVEGDRFAAADRYKGNPYPVGEERAKINAAFDSLMATLKTREGDDGNVVMFSRKPSEVLHLSGEEFGGGGLPLRRRIEAALREARDKFAGTAVTNASDGSSITIPASGLKHAMSGQVSPVALAAMSHIDEVVQNAQFVEAVPDKMARRTIKEIRYYDLPVTFNGDPVTVRVVVRVALDGARYYDHFEQKKTPAGLSGEQGNPESIRPFTGAAESLDTAGMSVSQPGDKGKPALSRTPERIAALKLKETQSIVDAITSKWANAPEVIVLANMADPRTPPSVRDYDMTQRSQGAQGEPAAFINGGKVYLVASQMKATRDVVQALFHETLGHAGLRGAFGPALDGILDRMGRLNAAQVKAKAQQYGLDFDDPKQRRQAAEEVLAEMAEKQPQIGWVQQAIAAVRSWLRENVPGFADMKFSDAEIVRSFLAPARGFIERGGFADTEPMVNRPAAFSRDGAVTVQSGAVGKLNRVMADAGWEINHVDIDLTGDRPKAEIKLTRADGRWVFAKVDSQGRASFETFQREKSLGMSSNTKGRRPLSPQVDDLFLGRTKFEGARGMMRGLTTYLSDNALNPVAISDMRAAWAGVMGAPTQIGIDNPRTQQLTNDTAFSRTLADAMNNVRDVNLPADYKVGDLFNGAGKLSWWHKTVGTMHNLAQRSPEFRRVYDATQNFLNDVSYYATEAANLAPTILPKLESWKDIAKSPLSATDTKAISAPIFEGTLTWARDEHGKAVKLAELEAKAATTSTQDKAREMLRRDLISENVLKMWQGLPLDQYEAAVETRYGNQVLKAGVVWTDAELKAQFGLTDAQIPLYREFRTATDKSLTNLAISDMVRFGGDDVAAVRQRAIDSGDVNRAAEILRDHLYAAAALDGERKDVLNDTGSTMIDKAERATELMQRGYAPLSRFGQYTLDVVHNGERAYFGMFERAAERSKMARQMAANFPGAQITQGTVSQEAYKMFAGVSPETLELFGDMLGLEAQGDDAASKAFQTYLKVAKTNRSAMKRLIERKGIAGFSEDAGRVLAGFVYSNARQNSSNLHMGEMTDATAAIPQQQGQLKDVALNLTEYVKNPQEEAQALRGVLFAQYLGGSVASAMVNALQPLQVTFPYLSQYGGVAKAAKQMLAASRDALKRFTGDPVLDEALRKAEEEGIVSPQEVHQLMAQAMGRSALKSGDGTKLGDALATASNFRAKTMLAWGKVFGVAEQFNRRVTFIAAYRTALEQKIANPAGFAEKAVAETQFTYNKGNKPKWARGAIGSTLFTFKQYSINYVELLHRMARSGPEGRKAALLALGVLFLMTGASGLPGSDDLDDLIDGLLQRLGYNFSSKARRREFFADTLGMGDAGARFVEKGVSGLPGAPIDVSGRLGLGNLLPGTGLLTKKADYGSDVAEFFGPAGDLAKRAFQGAGAALSGDLGKGLVTLSPTAIQNAAKSLDMANTGMYRDQNGKKVIDVDGYDAAAKAIGFQPNDVARVQATDRQVAVMIALNKMREREIAGQWAQAIFEKDPEGIVAARQALAAWNSANPESPIRINANQIKAQVQSMMLTRDQRLQKGAPKEIRGEVHRQLAQNAL